MRMIVMTILCACACLRCINPVVQHTSFLPSIPHVKSYYKSRLPEAMCQYMRNVTCRCPHVFDTSFNFWVSHRDSLCITATSFNLNRSANWQLRKDHNVPLLVSRPLNWNSGWRCPVQRNQVSSNCHGWEINLDHLRESLVIAKYPVQVCNNILRFRFWRKNSWYGEQEILFRLLFRLVGLCQMHKHLTISSTNKQGASIDLILVLWCSPTELTNTPSSSGPTQYFIAVGLAQSNKYKHIRQSFSNKMDAHSSQWLEASEVGETD